MSSPGLRTGTGRRAIRGREVHSEHVGDDVRMGGTLRAVQLRGRPHYHSHYGNSSYSGWPRLSTVSELQLHPGLTDTCADGEG